MQCDLCGKEDELYLALIEGTELNVCKNCSKFGKIIKKIIRETKEIKEKEVKKKKKSCQKRKFCRLLFLTMQN